MKKIDYSSYQKPSDFVRFPQGDTTIRILSSGGLVKKHGMKTANGFIPLGDCTEQPDCPQCLKGNEPKQKWVWICLVRKTNEVKILDVGPQIGDAICKIGQQREQDPQEYDLVIHRVGENRETKYTVKPGEVKPITEAETKMVSPMKQFLIKKYFASDK